MTTIAAMFRALAVVSMSCVLLLVLGGVAAIQGPRLESLVAPVYSAIEPIAIEREGDGRTHVAVYAEKNRPCTFLSMSMLAGEYGEHATLVNVKSAPGLTRPLGPQWFSWSVDTKAAGRGGVMRGVWLHRCHSFWDTQTAFGDWIVP